ncbi:hypothetical protein F2Q68_00037962 [Brassica cretica]|uniref:Cytoplasmic tRNA 2-thiolation protein 2 n=1 Tax=Brassica cretica TaxID=69181 RepID=A0A8S9HAL8_BRACR|nr:hypothetical protein F2Q68_00037962 [Brassica cretica]
MTFGDGSDYGRFCADCFRSNVFGKFRLAVTSHAMITPSDNVLVAFSGGSSSRLILCFSVLVAIQFVHEWQVALKNYEASRDRSLPVFGVGVAFVDENSTEARDRLVKLLDSVSDVTGKEDLLVHLKMLSLQKVASENGYNRLVLGTCTSRLASHVLTATVKIFSMLMRDGSLKTVELPRHPQSGINDLVSSFVALLKEENPSRECTIVRTAAKLTPFHFNKIPERDDSNVPLATQRRLKKFNLKYDGSMTTESFCPIRKGPLNGSDSSEGCHESDALYAACCSSCRFQILPQDGVSSLEHFDSLLPHHMVSQVKKHHQKVDNQTYLRRGVN